jgi:large subunit ribosomal protein L32
MAVPKKKHSKARTKTKHSAYAQKVQKKLLNKLNIVTCLNCSAKIKERTICPECGFYKGEQRKTIKTNKAKEVIRV